MKAPVGAFFYTGLRFYSKETPAQAFFCEICKVFKNTYFEEYLQTTASENTDNANVSESIKTSRTDKKYRKTKN